MSSDTRQAIHLKTAQDLILKACAVLPEELVSLAESLNRIPARSLKALEPLPGYDQSLRDGYAVCRQPGKSGEKRNGSFQVVGEVAAGDTRQLSLKPGEAVRIMTGGLIPGHCRDVVPQESCTVVNGVLKVPARYSKQQGAFIHSKGSEVAKGRVLVPKGTAIVPEQQILLAGVGYDTVPVIRRPKVSFFCTGSELVTGSGALSAGQKFSANTHLLHGLINLSGAVVQEQNSVKDDSDAVGRVLTEMSRSGCDIIISTGGMGPGKFDLVEEVFSRMKGDAIYRSLHLRPGKSTLFGKLGRTLFFGLPGPPHAVHLLFNELVRPAILALQGAKRCHPLETKAYLLEDLHLPKRGLPRLKSGVLSHEDGQCRVRPAKSGEPSNCYIFCSAARRRLRKTEKVTVHLLYSS
ncbi:MAG: molybdopterin molybdotransferase MoeA [Desulfocapsa sp.]|nr:molybdopterin molybdotransferase MoeA [Desulfocapsa sp.]